MGMNDTPCALSGVWTGRFQREDADNDNAAFSAWLKVANGRISGSTLEPNNLQCTEDNELEAQLRGHLDGSEVVFLKTYQGLDLEPIYCEGVITEEGQKITGKWFYGWPNELSGTFEMTRQAAKAKADQALSNEVRR